MFAYLSLEKTTTKTVEITITGQMAQTLYCHCGYIFFWIIFYNYNSVEGEGGTK